MVKKLLDLTLIECLYIFQLFSVFYIDWNDPYDVYLPFQMKITLTLKDFLDIQSTYLIQIRQRTACYVLKILTTLEQQYQTPPTSTVLIMGDTSSTTTKGLILRILLVTTYMLLMNYVNWRYMVSNCFGKPKTAMNFSSSMKI